MYDRIYIAALIDAYGELLKERQREIMNMSFCLDYSLSEIGEELNISRQGVHDTIKRSVDILNFYEEKLSLLKKQAAREKIIGELRRDIESSKFDEVDKNKLMAKLSELEETAF